MMKGNYANNEISGKAVIAGISGKFPECSNIEEFKNMLYAGVDMVTDDDSRRTPGIYGLPSRSGKLKDLSRFDSEFFEIREEEAETMDPQLRLLLEVTYEAILDAGYSPEELRGTKTGVYIGQSFNGNSCIKLSDDEVKDYKSLGSSSTKTANAISILFDFQGPSYIVDTSCTSSLFAYANAVAAVENGDIDFAIVGGVNILLEPETSVSFQKLNLLSEEGECKSFDASGRGLVMSETVCVIFLQRKSDARRIYATNVCVKTNKEGYNKEKLAFPSGNSQKTLMEEVFRELLLLPNDITYLEANGIGIKERDSEELNAIVDVYCKDRDGPLLIGSVKSNMGHSGAAAGLASLAKVILMLEEGVIPQNLHFASPNPDAIGLKNGQLQVVDLNWPLAGEYVAVNSCGLGDACVHIVLQSNEQAKRPQVKCDIPKLVTVSGRTEEAVQHFLDQVECHKLDDELIALVHEINKTNTPGYMFRGFSLIGSNTREIQCSDKKRQMWFVYSGFGSQYVGMGLSLMVFEPYSKAMKKCAKALSTVGMDLMGILENCDESTWDDTTTTFVAITATQVAMTDLLTALGIKPDGIIGFSAGELVCAYADGCYTAEQTVLLSYIRGKCVTESKLIAGAMAAVGLSREETKKRLPDDLEIACNNGPNSVTVSGPEVPIRNFVNKLKAEGLFASLLRNCKFAYHSKYIENMRESFRAYQETIIPEPKVRTKKWISTSIPEENWHTELGKYASTEYFVNNMFNPVLFYEGLQHIPEDAILVEIGPRSLLQPILKSACPNCINIGLIQKGVSNEQNYFLTAVGRIHNEGIQVNCAELYPKVCFPVGSGTPSISPMIKWDHSREWNVPVTKSVKEGENSLEKSSRCSMY